jgi:hypothetical protein
MVTILVFVGSMALLYGLIWLSEAAFARWRPDSVLAQNPIATDGGPMMDNLAYGITGMGIPGEVDGTSVVEAMATEMAGETAAIGEAIAPIIESSQHFLTHGAEAIGHAVGEVLSGL